MVSCTSTSTHKLLHTITHCSTLQHSATHCNTLRHTTTQCNTLQSKFISELTVEIFHQRYGARNDLLHTPLGKTCYTLHHTLIYCKHTAKIWQDTPYYTREYRSDSTDILAVVGQMTMELTFVKVFVCLSPVACWSIDMTLMAILRHLFNCVLATTYSKQVD